CSEGTARRAAPSPGERALCLKDRLRLHVNQPHKGEKRPWPISSLSWPVKRESARIRLARASEPSSPCARKSCRPPSSRRSRLRSPPRAAGGGRPGGGGGLRAAASGGASPAGWETSSEEVRVPRS